MAVNTKKVERRELKFNSIEELERELGVLQAANATGSMRTTGNWSAGQILQHCARAWKMAIDGFPPEMKPPAIIKVLCKMIFKKKAVSGATAPAGIKLPKQASAFLPDDNVSFDRGMSQFRAQIDRTKAGEQFTAASPIFGPLSHDEWQRMQFGHCQSHLGFIHPK